MNYPVWDPGLAHGILIAMVAILHVYVSHFAVGGGFFLIITETLARRSGKEGLLDYLYLHARFFILLTLVFGAISGVGIWFTIGLINPEGTSTLIHGFVWAWAIEWVFFFMEIAAALVYYYGWNRMRVRDHLIVGWIYFITAWMSMVVINGIISFQLTPGSWLTTHAFWDGFLNPSYPSSLLARTGFALTLAGLFCLWTASRLSGQSLRTWLMRYAGGWALVGMIASLLGVAWWWRVIPDQAHALAAGNMPIALSAMGWWHWSVRLLLLLIVALAVVFPRSIRPFTAAVILLVGLVVMGSAEWVREAVRKPWVVYDYLYSNGIRAGEVEKLREKGLVSTARWIDPRAKEDPMALGEELFRVACGSCHSRSGYNGLSQRVGGWDQEYTAAWIQRIEYTLRPMPPWVGTPREADALATYLFSLAGESSGELEDNGAWVFQRRCSSCHTLTGERAMRERVEGLNQDDLDEFLSDMESDEMPPFTGTDAQRLALAVFLEELGKRTPLPGSAERGDER